jgi:hypothetical protein
MELYQLKLFVDLAEKKNFTQVANENYVTQAAVTLQIRKLESELGVPLFHRTTRAVTLLEAGQKRGQRNCARNQNRSVGIGQSRVGSLGRALRTTRLHQEIFAKISRRQPAH